MPMVFESLDPKADGGGLRNNDQALLLFRYDVAMACRQFNSSDNLDFQDYQGWRLRQAEMGKK